MFSSFGIDSEGHYFGTRSTFSRGKRGQGTRGRGSSGRGTVAHGTRGRGTTAHGTRGRGTTAHGTRGRGTTAHGTRGRGTTAHGTRGRGTTAHGTRGRGTSGYGTRGRGTSGYGTRGRGNSDQGTSGFGTDEASARLHPAFLMPPQTVREVHSNAPRYKRRSSADGDTPQRTDNLQSLFKQLRRIIQKDDITPRQAVIVLSTEKAGFTNCLKQEMDKGMTEMMLYACGKIAQADGPRQILLEILLEIIKSGFCNKILALICANSTTRNPDPKKAARQVSCCLYLMSLCLDLIPKHSTKEISMLFVAVNNVVNKTTIGRFENITDRLAEVTSRKDEVVRNFIEDRTESRYSSHDYRQPPDNFRSISVFPTLEDIIMTSRPFLRKNQIDSAYNSVDDYLDVQFRLLREDFIRPLREGIQSYHKLGKDATSYQISKLDDIKVYQNVRVEFPQPSDTGMQYLVHFDTEMLHRVDWENSKRFMFGNLLCFSSDNFKEHFLFGVVAERDARQLQHGHLMVNFVTPDQPYEEEELDWNDNTSTETDNPLVDMSLEYTLIETDAFFEAYHHVLAGLKETYNLPVHRYIVDCSKQIQSPLYLRNSASIYSFKPLLEKPFPAVNVLNHSQWPTAAKLHLDESQKFALQTAITKEIALIQGPPGTGKTYVGLKMMQLLLANCEPSVISKEIKNPILVVCYTNHALDQFLEGIAKFHPEGIVRVGGRCKTESLKKYMLGELKRAHRGFGFRDVKDEVKNAMQPIQNALQMLQASSRCVISLSQLRPVIPTNLFQQFVQYYQPGKFKSSYDNALLDWLGFSNVESLTTISYIVKEVIPVWAQPLLHQGFQIDHIKQAVAASESLDYPLVVTWMTIHPRNNDPVNIQPDIVYNFLEYMDLPVNVAHLLDVYHHIEVKCAVYVLTEDQQYKNSVEQSSFSVHVKRWLMQRSEPKETTVQDEANVYDETDFIQDTRKMDTDLKSKNKKSYQEVDKLRNSIAATTHQTIFNSEAGFQMTKSDKRAKTKALKKQLNQTKAMSKYDMEAVENIMYLTESERWELYRTWVDQWRIPYRNTVAKHIDNYNKQTAKLKEIREEESFAVLRGADVIGMTTTGAAKYRSIISRLPVKVVIVEEAAEVLEAHIVTSMPQSTEHLILIGDHQQLKPSPTVYDLAKRMNLDVSLFERLVKNELPFAQLTCQHRMKPRIADLIRPHIYKTLTDHEVVKKYEDIPGVEKSLYFISHGKMEDKVTDSKSKKNQHEAEFMVALCKYFLLHEFKPEQITILTTYTGQLLELKNIIRSSANELKGVYVTAVDNFQGEENDIILLSLVRSNEQKSIGFLKIHNRVCVALSRAKRGLFCIGNLQLLRSESKIWESIVSDLERDQLIGPALKLQCKNHPETCVLVESAKDFQKFPGGSCNVPCNYRLDCGHVCTRTCHLDDSDHSKFICKKPCTKACPDLGHKCLKQCWKDCGSCPVLVDKTMPVCQHIQTMKCGIKPEDFVCKMPCPKMFSCGHQCQLYCGEECKPCGVKVEKKIPKCGHTQEMACFESPLHHKCKESCEKTLSCGHSCPELCYVRCPSCRVNVEKTMPTCGHVQEMECSCDPKYFQCQEICDKTLPCGHKCTKKCSELCSKCPENVVKNLSCGHKKNMRCSDDVASAKCYSNCEKVLKCGHPCPRMCWEKCSNICFVDVSVKLPACGHEQNVKCIASEKLYSIPCKQKCEAVLDCGHACPGNCTDCLRGRVHVKCSNKCEKKLKCGHPCSGTCSVPCPPCTTECEIKCVHQKCANTCSSPCRKCRFACTWKCPHFKCTRLCSEACNRPPCNEPCPKILKCKHPCIGLCGEPCPKLCRVCNKRSVEKSIGNTENPEDAKFVELPGCGHLFTVKTLDQIMGLGGHGNFNDSTVKHCPKCNTAITTCTRYGQLLSLEWRNANLLEPLLTPRKHDLMAIQNKYSETVSQNTMHNAYTKEALNLVQKISKTPMTNSQLNFCNMKLANLYKINELNIRTENLLKNITSSKSIPTQIQGIAVAVNILGKRLINEKEQFTKQQIREFDKEIKHLEILILMHRM
nr:NFX1-type zinc finger-containing protein 1-like isoform X1 [Ciona intestinalis]|eukprot:XP_026689972.1 NFX1-type zinc finger-containing protein 1-like isoform X1 [Ciona intestinalis]